MKIDSDIVLNSEKMENISHLSSALAHEIRNPLTVAKGFLQLITSNELNDEKNTEYVRIALSEIDRAESIIKNFLTFARPETEVIKNVCLAKEIEKVLVILQPLANQNAVQILCECHSNGNIFGESTFIQQCFLNLCKNSIEAMENGGTLSIYLCEDLNNIHVDIHDTGVGMNEEQLKQLGKPFYSTKGEKGTGLGLFATYGLMEKLNGTIKVSSKKNHGTLFSLSFPLIGKEKQMNVFKKQEHLAQINTFF